MKRLLMALLIALAPLTAANAGAEAAKPAPKASAQVAAPSDVPALSFEKYTLPNGLEVILHRDQRLPVVAVDVWYHVGAFHESPDRTGFAHLFEHMMFQGSKNVADDQHIALLEKIGATDLNGTTDFDRTNYFETVPSNHLETALWLESDRMGFLLDALTQEKLDTQREVVKNERRQSIETAPYGLAEEKFWKALFPAPHPYFGVVIGSMADLDAATLSDVMSFFRKWYAPSNATLAIAGDFDPARTKALVEKYFGSLPKVEDPKPPRVAEVKLDKEIVLHHDEPVATLPSVMVGWHSPRVFAPGDATADVLASILTHGKASRLHRRLVREKQLAQSVRASQQSLGAQSVFSITAIARPGVSTDALLSEIDAVLQEIRSSGVTADEVERAQNKTETAIIAQLQRVGGFGGVADRLQTYNHYLGDPDYLAQDIARYRAVTPQSVQTFTREVLAPDRRVVLHAVPKAGKPQAAASQEGR